MLLCIFICAKWNNWNKGFMAPFLSFANISTCVFQLLMKPNIVRFKTFVFITDVIIFTTFFYHQTDFEQTIGTFVTSSLGKTRYIEQMWKKKKLSTWLSDCIFNCSQFEPSVFYSPYASYHFVWMFRHLNKWRYHQDEKQYGWRILFFYSKNYHFALVTPG